MIPSLDVMFPFYIIDVNKLFRTALGFWHQWSFEDCQGVLEKSRRKIIKIIKDCKEFYFKKVLNWNEMQEVRQELQENR